MFGTQDLSAKSGNSSEGAENIYSGDHVLERRKEEK